MAIDPSTLLPLHLPSVHPLSVLRIIKFVSLGSIQSRRRPGWKDDECSAVIKVQSLRAVGDKRPGSSEQARPEDSKSERAFKTCHLAALSVYNVVLGPQEMTLASSVKLENQGWMERSVESGTRLAALALRFSPDGRNVAQRWEGASSMLHSSGSKTDPWAEILMWLGFSLCYDEKGPVICLSEGYLGFHFVFESPVHSSTSLMSLTTLSPEPQDTFEFWVKLDSVIHPFSCGLIAWLHPSPHLPRTHLF